MTTLTKKLNYQTKRKHQAKQKSFTYEDYYNLDDGIRYELINGELFMSPAPTFYHQDFILELATDLFYYCKSNHLGKIIISPIDVILDIHNTFQPDIIFISKENLHIIHERGIFGAPDVVIEILSPSTTINDRHTKKDLYEKFGVKEYWIVDIANRVVEVFLNKDSKFELVAYRIEKDKVKSFIIEGFEADLEKLFSSLNKLVNKI